MAVRAVRDQDNAQVNGQGPLPDHIRAHSRDRVQARIQDSVLAHIRVKGIQDSVVTAGGIGERSKHHKRSRRRR